MIEFTKSEPAVAPAPKMAAFPSFSPSFLAHAPCCRFVSGDQRRSSHGVADVEGLCIHTYLGMLRVGGVVRVLRRLRKLRHVDVVLPLGEPRVDVGAWDSSRSLHYHFVSKLELGFWKDCKWITHGKLVHDGFELLWGEKAGFSKVLQLRTNGAEGPVRSCWF